MEWFETFLTIIWFIHSYYWPLISVVEKIISIEQNKRVPTSQLDLFEFQRFHDDWNVLPIGTSFFGTNWREKSKDYFKIEPKNPLRGNEALLGLTLFKWNKFFSIKRSRITTVNRKLCGNQIIIKKNSKSSTLLDLQIFRWIHFNEHLLMIIVCDWIAKYSYRWYVRTLDLSFSSFFIREQIINRWDRQK